MNAILDNILMGIKQGTQKARIRRMQEIVLEMRDLRKEYNDLAEALDFSYQLDGRHVEAAQRMKDIELTDGDDSGHVEHEDPERWDGGLI